MPNIHNGRYYSYFPETYRTRSMYGNSIETNGFYFQCCNFKGQKNLLTLSLKNIAYSITCFGAGINDE